MKSTTSSGLERNGLCEASILSTLRSPPASRIAATIPSWAKVGIALSFSQIKYELDMFCHAAEIDLVYFVASECDFSKEE